MWGKTEDLHNTRLAKGTGQNGTPKSSFPGKNEHTDNNKSRQSTPSCFFDNNGVP